jgi:iron complex outermembrane recepter protein
MKRTAPGPTAAKLQPSLALRTSVAALAAAGLLTSFSVIAQEATPADSAATTVVTVTGMRQAAQSAQKIKKDSDDVIDSIVADDIGKFPDTNVAETLARVSGIQVRRDAGEANSVLIRGLPGIATMLNGREMFTTTGRYIQLADIPSTMLQRADVYKSQSADLIEGGIAGVIDVRTNRPFDFKGFQVSAQGGVTNKDKVKKTDPQGSFMVSNRWKTGAGEFGALFGASIVRDHFHEERAFNTFPIQKDWLLPKLTGPDLVGLEDIYGMRKRTAENFALQWKPNRDLELYAEGLNTHYHNNDETDFFVGLPWWAPGDQISGTKIPGTDQLDTLTSHQANTILSTQARQSDNKTSQYAIGAKWRIADGLRASTEFARTKSTYDWQNPILDTLVTVPDVYVKTNVDGSAYMKYGGMDMTNPQNIYLFQLFDRYGRDNGRSNDWRADVQWTPEADGLIKEVDAGVRVNKRSAESIKSLEGSVGAPNAFDANTRVSAATIPGLNCVTQPMSVNYGTPQWYTPCASYLISNTSVVRQAVTGSSAPKAIDQGSFFRDDEKNTAFYLKAKLGFDLGSFPVDGVVGARVTHTTEDLLGYSLANGTFVATPKDASSTDVLPSASFKLHLRRDLIGRVALAKTLTRPDFAQLNPGTAYVNSNGTTVQASASGGNPDLKPFTGQNMDAALEWYFAPTGMVSGTVFRHNFDGYIMYKTVPEVYQGVNYDTSRPFNTDKGHLQGVELAYQQFYDWLPGWLQGFGTQANVTYMQGGVTSSVNQNLAGKPFAGMSKWSYNVVALYEHAQWSGRLAYNWRSKFVQVYGDRPGNAGTSPARDLIAAPMSSLDGSLSYKITPNLSVNLTGTNLLNFKYVDYWDNADTFPRDTRRYDRTVGISLNWKN